MGAVTGRRKPGPKSLPKEDLVGRRFDRLEVVSYHGPLGHGHHAWDCRCECGSHKVVSRNQLMMGKVRSCGCLQEELYAKMREDCIAKNTKPAGVAAFNAHYNSYLQRSRDKKIVFELSQEQFRELSGRPCFYCGSPPELRYVKEYYNGPCVTNGLDRVDNSRGYIADNVVACCAICNKAKRDLPIATFTAWLDRLVAYRGQK